MNQIQIICSLLLLYRILIWFYFLIFEFTLYGLYICKVICVHFNLLCNFRFKCSAAIVLQSLLNSFLNFSLLCCSSWTHCCERSLINITFFTLLLIINSNFFNSQSFWVLIVSILRVGGLRLRNLGSLFIRFLRIFLETSWPH